MSRWINQNLNPKGRQIGDCTVRAIAKATGQTWDETYIGLAAEGFNIKDMPSSNSVWGRYLQRHGFRRFAAPDRCPECYTVEEFCADHPYGTYVLALQSHVVAAIDGRFFDSWPSGQEAVIFYWERID